MKTLFLLLVFSFSAIASYDPSGLSLKGVARPEFFYAEVSGSDVVTGENKEWVAGNCTNVTTGRATCTVAFSAAPKCWLSWLQTSGVNAPVVCAWVSAPTTTTLDILCKDGGGAVLNYAFTVFCVGK